MKIVRAFKTGIAAILASVMVCGAAAAFPDKPLKLIVPWAAGGGTDATGRIVSQMLEAKLGQPVNVINRTGGGGVIGHDEIARSAADGYTLGVLTSELSVYHWLGQSTVSYKDFDLIGLYNIDPQAIHVAKGSKYADLKVLADALRNDPASVKVGGASRGGTNHLSYISFLKAIGAEAEKANWIPTEGAAPALQLLTSGAIDVVIVNLPEARALVDAGEVVAVASFGDERGKLFQDVPTVAELVGSSIPIRTWRGIGAPKGVPAEVRSKLVDALEEIVQSPEFVELMDRRQFTPVWLDANDFTEYLAGRDTAFGDAAKAAGLAQAQ